MSKMRLVHGGTECPFAIVETAENWLSKGIGVIGMPSLPPGHGLWLPGVSAVHTWFVRFPLDLLFLDRDGRAVKVALNIRPWTFLVCAPGAAGVVELGAGTLLEGKNEVNCGEKWILELIGE